MAIVDLTLCGNPLLESQTWYRVHTVDCLPHVWMLDGRIITSAERLKVEQFFDDSALTKRPIRHRLPKKPFISSDMRMRQTQGTFGAATNDLLLKFPLHLPINEAIDARRLAYLCENVQEELKLESNYKKLPNAFVAENPCFVSQLLQLRTTDQLTFNVVTLLLLGSLLFHIPSSLVCDFVARANLEDLSGLNVAGLFQLPSSMQRSVLYCCVSMVKFDRDHGKDSGMHDLLYLSIYFSLSELCVTGKKRPLQAIVNARNARRLIAMEVVRLLSICPSLYTAVNGNPGITRLIATATCNNMVLRLAQLMLLDDEEKMMQEQCESAANLLLNDLRQRTDEYYQCSTQLDVQQQFVLTVKNAVPKKPMQWAIFASQFHTRGVPSPGRPLQELQRATADSAFFPCASAQIGDRVLLLPQLISYIIALPEPNVALVQMPRVPNSHGHMTVNIRQPDEHYSYIDMSRFIWRAGMWRRRSAADSVTLPSETEDKKCQLREVLNASNQDYGTSVCGPATYVVDQTPSLTQNASQPTPSVAVAFKSRQDLKLVFSSNPKDNWILLSNDQLALYTSAGSRKQKQADGFSQQPAAGLWPFSARAAREIPKCKSVATGVTTADVTEPQQDACTAGVTEESSAGLPNAGMHSEPTQHSDSEQPATDVKAPATSVAPDQRTATAAHQQHPVQSSSDAYLHAVIPNLDAILAENDFSSLDAQKRAARENVTFMLPNPLPAADHIRVVTTSEGDFFIAEKRKLPCVEYIARGDDVICPLEELPTPAELTSCCDAVPRSVVSRAPQQQRPAGQQQQQQPASLPKPTTSALPRCVRWN